MTFPSTITCLNLHKLEFTTIAIINIGRGFMGIIPLPIPIIGDSEVQTEDFYMPPVILWNPYLIYPQFITPGSIKCTICGSPLLEGYWNDGSSASKQPRIIHGVDRMVLLVCAVYICDNRHKMVSCDEIVSIENHHPILSITPHRYYQRPPGYIGFFVQTGCELLQHGMESYIMERRWKDDGRHM